MTRISGAPVFSGARKPTPWAAVSNSMPMIWPRLSFISRRRRAAWQDIETWSSWSAEVGVLSIERGLASALFSLISAAEVTSAIMKPELSPGAGERKAGRWKLRLGSTSRAMRRWAMAPSSAMASAIWSAAKATGSAWKLPPETMAPSASTSGLSVTALASISRVAALWRSRSRAAPATWGWQRIE